MGAAVLGFGFDVADASMVTWLDMFAVGSDKRRRQRRLAW
jgi:hypothetical protein